MKHTRSKSKALEKLPSQSPEPTLAKKKETKPKPEPKRASSAVTKTKQVTSVSKSEGKQSSQKPKNGKAKSTKDVILNVEEKKAPEPVVIQPKIARVSVDEPKSLFEFEQFVQAQFMMS